MVEVNGVALDVNLGDKLKSETSACKLSIGWLGTNKGLTKSQKKKSADVHNARPESLRASKAILDTRHPRFAAVTEIRTKARNYWTSVTVPYPVDGIRLIRTDKIDLFAAMMDEHREELKIRVGHLADNMAVLIERMRQPAPTGLGDLFNAADYPDDVRDCFSIDYEFPSVDPPDFLQQLNPELYAQQQARVKSRFDLAVDLAQDAFAAELAKMVSELSNQIKGLDDGTCKRFSPARVKNLQDFFGRFNELNIGGNAQLETLVGQMQSLVGGVAPEDVKGSAGVRATIQAGMADVTAELAGMLEAKPARKFHFGGAA